jgi:CHASE2 domain-containing sensor protein
VLWGSFAYYLLLPANRAPDAISARLAHTDDQPEWISAIMNGLSQAADHRGFAISIVLAILCAGVASALLARPLLRPALALAIALGLLFWIAQGFGGMLTGHGTDPNSGLLLILLAACFWPRCSPERTP